MKLNETTNRFLNDLLICEKGDKSEEELLRSLEKKLSLAESAGDFKAQADYWKEQYQSLRKQCLRALSGHKSIKRLRETLEEDVMSIY